MAVRGYDGRTPSSVEEEETRRAMNFSWVDSPRLDLEQVHRHGPATRPLKNSRCINYAFPGK